MATDFLNDVRRVIEGRTEDFYGELKAFYQGNAKAEQKLMEQTTQPFWQSLCLCGKRLQQRDLTVGIVVVALALLVICAENAPEGITVTATLVDENWDPVQE